MNGSSTSPVPRGAAGDGRKPGAASQGRVHPAYHAPGHDFYVEPPDIDPALTLDDWRRLRPVTDDFPVWLRPLRWLAHCAGIPSPRPVGRPARVRVNGGGT